MKQLNAAGTMAVSCMGFLVLGLVTAAIGPALPDLSERTGSSLALLGTTFTALFLGALLAQLIAGPLNDRLSQRPLLIAGLTILACGLLGMIISRSLLLLLACAAFAGLGHGLVDVGMNLLIAEVFARRSAAALNLLNVFFGVGAVAGPAIAGLTLRVRGTALPVLWIGAGLLLLQVPLVPFLAAVPRASDRAGAPREGRAVYRSLALWGFGLLLLLYVGTENGIGGWTTAYLAQTTPIGTAAAALVTSGFWLALTGGRVIGALLGMRMPPAVLLLASLLGALAGGALLVTSTGSALLSTVAVLVIGLCFGPIFPTTLAITTATFRHAPGAAASVVVAMGSIGGMLLPWLQGVLLERSGPLASVALVAACILAMLVLWVGYGAVVGRSPSPGDWPEAVVSRER